jgi:glyoxylase-like metal-dependent hydrolase (beta-lactamase superfamily II)
MQAQIHPFFDEATWTFSYVVYDQQGGHAAVIDPVLDYDPKSGRTSTLNADRIIQYLRDKQLVLDWILETHAHADHLSSAHYLREQCGGKIGIGARIDQVQQVFKKIFHLEADLKVDGSQFDHLFQDGEIFQVGALSVSVIAVPGHTPADIAYRFGQAVFVGDTLFMPDVGTARCDFPGGSAHDLYQSIQKLYALPANTALYMCHDYPPNEREPAWQSTVAEQRAANIHVHDGVNETSFIDLRSKRDATLQKPVLIIPSIQVNIRAGEFPAPEENGVSYLKIPLNLL